MLLGYGEGTQVWATCYEGGTPKREGWRDHFEPRAPKGKRERGNFPIQI